MQYYNIKTTAIETVMMVERRNNSRKKEKGTSKKIFYQINIYGKD